MVDFTYGIITISDRCFRGETKDESGPKIKYLLQDEYNAHNIKQEIIPDDQNKIEEILILYSDVLKINCIFTTGGTGCSPRDVTPEATRKIIHKEFPQLSMVMLLEGLRKTEFAALTRLICGIRNNSLIINFPGSVKAVTESFNAIKRLIPHAVDLICDIKDKTESVHKQIQSGTSKNATNDFYREIKEKTNDSIDEVLKNYKQNSASNSESNLKRRNEDTEVEPKKIDNQKSNQSSTKPQTESSAAKEVPKPSTTRAPHVCPHKTAKPGDKDDRNSPYPMISVEEALKIIFSNIRPISKPQTIRSPINCPPFRASIKDGYAVKSSSKSTLRKVIGSISAGDFIIQEDFKEDECYKINTGAAVPDFADAIVQVEDTKLTKSNPDGSEAEIELLSLPSKNLDIREIGSDLMENQELFTTNGLLDVAEKTILASVGLNAAEKKPKIAIISTGDELQDPASGELQEGHIYDSNTTMLKLLCEKFNFDVKFTCIAKDDYESLKNVVSAAIKECRVIISSGGVSMGDKDFIKKVLIDLDFKIHFGRVNVKPGKPMTFATLNENSFFALPGNPVSAFVTFHLFVLPALRFISGYSGIKCILPLINVVLEDSEYHLDDRPEYVRAKISYDQNTNQFTALVNANQISSRIASLINADVLLKLPGRKEYGNSIIEKGTKLKAMVINQFFISFINE
ncbi:hypothetical protein PVAND_014848 [Polypedilum vanderplanki]|uniref:MoaB/Mog domain-containing protein n=1 Tax=Polypedilum vanderplanki TaxID=319348 RepID=A0A9J6BB71_POLVA|nr:hypothetical protein PVAND_014848 [Polypedilum vanderplanki]